MHLKTVLLLACAIIAASCGDPQANKVALHVRPLPSWVTAGEPAPYLDIIVGEKNLSILRKADRIESFRIDSKKYPDAPNTINGYPRITTGPDLDAVQATNARRITNRLESYFPLGAKMCGEIRPGVALRFHRGPEYVTAIICFDCREWYFEFGDETDGGRHRSKLNFDGTQAELLRLMRELFPNDRAIGSIVPIDRYTVAYQVPAALPASEEDIKKDYASGSAMVLAKYVPDAVMKLNTWKQGGGFEDNALPLDGLLFIYTTKENHRIISKASSVRVVD